MVRRRKQVGLPRWKQIDTQLVQVGREIFPIYGNSRVGFSPCLEDFNCGVARECLYDSRDELLFALVNYHACREGSA